MEKTLLFKDIHPFIRYAQLIHINSSHAFKNVKSYDYRLFYVYNNSKGIIYIDNVMYEVSSGDLFLWQPGIIYSLLYHKNSQLDLIGLSFDFTQNNINKSFPIGPVGAKKFVNKDIVESIKFNDLEVFNEPLYLGQMNILEEDLLEIYNEFKTKKVLRKQNIWFIHLYTE